MRDALAALQDSELNPAWSYNKAVQDFKIQCDFKGQLHVPVWATPASIALVFVGCLLGCWFKRRELVHTVRAQQHCRSLQSLDVSSFACRWIDQMLSTIRLR